MFNCRGYSIISIVGSNKFICLIHSDNSKIYGPRSLETHKKAQFYEKARCLNSKAISIVCNFIDKNFIFNFSYGNVLRNIHYC